MLDSEIKEITNLLESLHRDLISIYREEREKASSWSLVGHRPDIYVLMTSRVITMSCYIAHTAYLDGHGSCHVDWNKEDRSPELSVNGIPLVAISGMSRDFLPECGYKIVVENKLPDKQKFWELVEHRGDAPDET